MAYAKEVDIYKEQLPSGWSYALKPSLLEYAIVAAGILLPVALHQQHKRWATAAPAFSGTFHPRGSFLGGEFGSVKVTSCAISSDQREAAQNFVELEFIPAFIKWIIWIEALPENSTIRREKQEFVCDGAPLALNARTIGSIPKGQRRQKRAIYKT